MLTPLFRIVVNWRVSSTNKVSSSLINRNLRTPNLNVLVTKRKSSLKSTLMWKVNIHEWFWKRFSNPWWSRGYSIQTLFLKPGSSINTVFLKVLYWNILKGDRDFLKDDYFFSWLRQFNLVFISETHSTKEQKFDLEGYKSYHNSFLEVNSRKPCSGVGVFIQSSIQDYVLNVDHSNYTNHVIVTLSVKGVWGVVQPPLLQD